MLPKEVYIVHVCFKPAQLSHILHIFVVGKHGIFTNLFLQIRWCLVWVKQTMCKIHLSAQYLTTHNLDILISGFLVRNVVCILAFGTLDMPSSLLKHYCRLLNKTSLFVSPVVPQQVNIHIWWKNSRAPINFFIIPYFKYLISDKF